MEQQTETTAVIGKDETNRTVHFTHSINGEPQNNRYLTSFENHHLGCLLTVRKKEQIKSPTVQLYSNFAAITADSENSKLSQMGKNQQSEQNLLDSSLIYRPKNKRKQQQATCLHETPNKMDKKDKFMPYNPQKKNNQQFKVLTRRSHEYQPAIQQFQSQNPANRTLPS